MGSVRVPPRLCLHSSGQNKLSANHLSKMIGFGGPSHSRRKLQVSFDSNEPSPSRSFFPLQCFCAATDWYNLR